MTTKPLTPMMEQWQMCKNRAKEALLLFRLGDFYEAFHEDAITLSNICNVTLTKRSEALMSGVPAHTLDSYVEKLIKAGMLVAIAEQTQEASFEKKLVRREITRLVSPSLFPNVVDKNATFFAGVFRIHTSFVVCFMEYSLGSIQVIQKSSFQDIYSELVKHEPKEIITNEESYEQLQAWSFPSVLRWIVKPYTYFDVSMSLHTAKTTLQPKDFEHLQTSIAQVTLVGSMLRYVHEEMLLPIDHLHLAQKLSFHPLEIDCITERHLNLLGLQQKETSLYNIIDLCKTAMGSRLLRSWITKPLTDVSLIEERYDAIEELTPLASTITKLLEGICDIERLTAKLEKQILLAKEYLSLRNLLTKNTPLKELHQSLRSSFFSSFPYPYESLQQLYDSIENALSDDLLDGIFRRGYHRDLDELRTFQKKGSAWLVQYQDELRKNYDIKTLKVSYNKAFGYYIEVSKGQSHKIPSSLEKKQTLVNAERFISDKLKDYEIKSLSADSRLEQLESTLFEELQASHQKYCPDLRLLANYIAHLDVIFSLANAAKRFDLHRPSLEYSKTLSYRKGRHLIVEQHMPKMQFIPNDLTLHGSTSFSLITGPNMGGKSTYIRQSALIVIMAQMGSFVPAKEATIGIVDRIFTRIGANDNLAEGKSTFMVEMMETANIMKHVQENSLVILDEIGRGTSTYDGISLAFAVSEFLAKKRIRTLFATHYLELTKLAEDFPQVRNDHVLSQESQGKVVFLHRIQKGIADKSYGLHVAKIAGMPEEILLRAYEILQKFEKKEPIANSKKKSTTQLSFFPEEKLAQKILQQLRHLSIETMTPLEALTYLDAIKKEIMRND